MDWAERGACAGVNCVCSSKKNTHHGHEQGQRNSYFVLLCSLNGVVVVRSNASYCNEVVFAHFFRWSMAHFRLWSNAVVLHEHVCLMWYSFFSVHVGWVDPSFSWWNWCKSVKDCKPSTFCCSGKWPWARSILKCNRKLWKVSFKRNGSVLFSNERLFKRLWPLLQIRWPFFCIQEQRRLLDWMKEFIIDRHPLHQGLIEERHGSRATVLSTRRGEPEVWVISRQARSRTQTNTNSFIPEVT